jgi:DNA-binding NarL/FixJ family response regulator
MENSRVQILIADNQYLVTQSLVNFIQQKLRYKVAGVVGSKYDLERLLKEDLSLVILDTATVGLEGIPDVQAIFHASRVPVLVLTNTLSRSEIISLNGIGIRNFLLKSTDEDELAIAIEISVKGKKYVCQEVMDLMADPRDVKRPVPGQANLTTTETGIVKLIAEGLTTKEIAARKFISAHTVMTHRKNIFRKLQVNNASELVMYAIRNGIIDTIEYHI